MAVKAHREDKLDYCLGYLFCSVNKMNIYVTHGFTTSQHSKEREHTINKNSQ